MLDTVYINRCILTLEKAFSLLKVTQQEKIEYELSRSACIKEFEIILEQSGKLLKKKLKTYFSSTNTVDTLTFKELFKHAVVYGLMKDEECERWLHYRDIRNNTAHDYGKFFAENTILVLDSFIQDSKELSSKLSEE